MVTSYFIFTIASLLGNVYAAPFLKRGTQCVDGVMIVAARGSDGTWTDPNTTDPNYADIGAMQNIADQIIASVGQDSFLSAVPYPASSDFTQYATSHGHGIDATQSMIKSYVDQCKSTVQPRVVVLGYSQGAQVITDSLAGGDGRPNLDSYKQYIVAGAVFADPANVAGVEPLNVGGSRHGGTAARSAEAAQYLNTNYGQKLRSYCHRGDEYCTASNGPNALTIHHQAVGDYSQDALNFILPLVS